MADSAGGAVENPGWEEDVAGILAPFVPQMMWRLDLGGYDDVAANAAIIYFQISQGGMPPPPFPPLTPTQIQTFKNWMDTGCPRTRPPGPVSASAPTVSLPTERMRRF
jgi:hypothetical protein